MFPRSVHLRPFFAALAILAVSAINSFAETAQAVPLPSVPSDLRDPGARADYIIEHFWDGVESFSDFSSEAIEQAFADYISVFPYADGDSRRLAAKSLIKRASSEVDQFARVSEIIEKYLYNLDSPVESEEYFLIFIDEIINSPEVDDSYKIRPRAQREDIARNFPGTSAADFQFETFSGDTSSLLDVIASLNGENLELLFYDPDCGHCRELVREMSSRSNGPTVLAIYSGDDRDLWKSTLSDLPDNWIKGYDDGTLQEDNLYVIRSLPTVYIIDGRGTVLKKQEKF